MSFVEAPQAFCYDVMPTEMLGKLRVPRVCVLRVYGDGGRAQARVRGRADDATVPRAFMCTFHRSAATRRVATSRLAAGLTASPGWAAAGLQG
eukprot:2615475-Prymnesium_polylepis.1